MPTQTKLKAQPRKAPRTGVDFKLRRNTSAPLYQQVQSLIHEHIAQGRLAEGDRLPSLKQLSDEMGIAYATVARGVRTLVENGALEARAGSGTQVAAPSRQNTIPDSSATKTGLIGYIGSNTAEESHNFYYLSIVAGIESVAFEHEMRLMLLTRDSKIGWDKVDGILVQDANPQRIVEQLPPSLPRVCLLRTTDGVAGVLADEYNGARLGVRHLLELGHRRIAYLVQESAASSIPSVRQRVNGFRDTLHEAGIAPEANWLYGPPKDRFDSYVDWGYRSMCQWLNGDFEALKFTAIFVQNDLIAIGAINALQKAGLRVPHDVSVLSFDGTAVCELFSPTISAIAVPLRRLGAVAMELLASQIGGGKLSDETIVLPARLQKGESSARVAHS